MAEKSIESDPIDFNPIDSYATGRYLNDPVTEHTYLVAVVDNHSEGQIVLLHELL